MKHKFIFIFILFCFKWVDLNGSGLNIKSKKTVRLLVQLLSYRINLLLKPNIYFVCPHSSYYNFNISGNRVTNQEEINIENFNKAIDN